MRQSRSILQFVLLLALVGLSRTLVAKDFAIDARDHDLRFTVSGDCELLVHNLTTHPLRLTITAPHTSYVYVRTMGYDSTNYMKDYPISIGYGWTTVHQSEYMIVSDATGSDTIHISGSDSSLSGYLPFNTSISLLQFHHAKTYGLGGFNVENYADSIQHVTVHLTQSGSAFSLDSTVYPIGLTDGGHPSSWIFVPIHYRKTGNDFDTAYVTIGSWTNSATRTYLVTAIADPSVPDVDLFWNYHYQLRLNPGDSACVDRYIYNRSNESVTLTAARSLSENWSIDTTLFPITIGANDSATVHLCYASPSTSDYGAWHYGTFELDYTDSSLFTGTFTGSMVARTQGCLDGTDSLKLEPVELGGFVTGTFTIINRLPYEVTVFDSIFTYDTTVIVQHVGVPFPVHLVPGDSIHVTYKFRSLVAGYRAADVAFCILGDTDRCTTYHTMYGYVYDPSDSSVKSLFPAQGQNLMLYSNGGWTSKTYSFKNDEYDSIKVVSISLTDSTHYQITNISRSLPTIMARNGTIDVTLAFDGDTTAVADLVIVTDNALTAYTYHLHGSRSTPLGVNSGDSPKMVLVYPNPTSGMVTISNDGLSNAHVDILDLLGRTIYSTAIEHSTTWGTDAAAGTYIVRLTGTTTTGERVTRSSRFVRK